MSPVEELMNEHRLIEKMLAELETRLAAGEAAPFPADFIAQALDFFVNFADGCHHYKEEEALFPALAQKGIPVEGGPIGMMLYEHTVGRKCLAGIRENLEAARAGDEEAKIRVRSFSAEYAQLLRQHIWKEDNVLFRMAQQALGPQDSRALLERFHDQSNPRIQDEVRQRYERLVNSLSAA